jgi:hypothetical protein
MQHAKSQQRTDNSDVQKHPLPILLPRQTRDAAITDCPHTATHYGSNSECLRPNYNNSSEEKMPRNYHKTETAMLKSEPLLSDGALGNARRKDMCPHNLQLRRTQTTAMQMPAVI